MCLCIHVCTSTYGCMQMYICVGYAYLYELGVSCEPVGLERRRQRRLKLIRFCLHFSNEEWVKYFLCSPRPIAISSRNRSVMIGMEWDGMGWDEITTTMTYFANPNRTVKRSARHSDKCAKRQQETCLTTTECSKFLIVVVVALIVWLLLIAIVVVRLLLHLFLSFFFFWSRDPLMRCYMLASLFMPLYTRYVYCKCKKGILAWSLRWTHGKRTFNRKHFV